jgi:hypothetical protein
MAPLQQQYFDILMDRIRDDHYPSHQLLDRVEGALASSDQVAEYVAMLIAKVGESHYPSGQMLDRIDRMLRRTAVAAR